MSMTPTHFPAPTWELRHRLARSIEWAGIAKEDMAAELGVTRQTIDNYCSGRTVPPRGYLRVWAEVTRIPMSWLVDGDELNDPSIRREPDDQLALFFYEAA